MIESKHKYIPVFVVESDVNILPGTEWEKTLWVLGFKRVFNINQAELVLAIGGDGTVIRAAYQALKYMIPVLGYNKGTLGFLTAGEGDLPSLLKDYKEEKLEVENRDVLVLNRGYTDERYVFNEVAIITAQPGRLVSIKLDASDGFIAEYKGDGLIISTPTGSTAWNLSAGGPILHHKAKGIVITPITPFSLSARPIVVGDDLKLITFIDETQKVIIDGEEKDYNDSYISISKSRHTFKLIRPKNYFYESIRSKLGWGFQIKEKRK